MQEISRKKPVLKNRVSQEIEAEPELWVRSAKSLD
jgi:hypothetical protein